MKNRIKKSLKASNGITLIALVITIIVLLILAGISISMLSGDNGILQKATLSKEKTERAEIIETAQMDILGKQAENHGSLSEDELEEILISTNYNTQGILSNESSILDRTLTSKDGKYKIRVSEIYEGTLISKSKPKVGDFVDYNVPYTDVYIDKEYTSKNGWRILNIGADENGIYNLEIIPTGVPAKVYYKWDNDPTESSNASHEWWGDLKGNNRVEGINSYYGKTFNENWTNVGSESISGYYAAYGLRNNFNNITFKYKEDVIPEINEGAYKSINGYGIGTVLEPNTELDVLTAFKEKTNKEGSTSTLANKITRIREVENIDIGIRKEKDPDMSTKNAISSDEDINSKGLFILQNIKNNTKPNMNMYEYNSDTYGMYWLSSPFSFAKIYMMSVYYDGSMDFRYNSYLGVRPVIYITGAQLIYDEIDGIWEIK